MDPKQREAILLAYMDIQETVFKPIEDAARGLRKRLINEGVNEHVAEQMMVIQYSAMLMNALGLKA